MAINSLSSASHGFSGLVSGINSQEMVEKLLSTTQGRIDSTVQNKAVLAYKQSMYREVATKMRNLQSTFMSFTSSTNLLSNAFYNTMSSTVVPPTGSSASFSVTATTSANAGTTTVDYIKQLATSATLKTQKQANSNIGLNLDKKVAENLLNDYRKTDSNGNESTTLTIQIGDEKVVFENAPMLFSQMSTDMAVSLINDKLSGKGGRAEFVNGKLSIVAEDPEKYITISGSGSDKTLAMKMFGDKTSISSKGSLSATMTPQNYNPSFTIDLDGRKQTIRLDLNKLANYVDGTAGAEDDLFKDLSDKLKKAFGNGVKLVEADGKYSLEPGDSSQRFTITGRNTILNALGIKSGVSNKINTSQAIRDLSFAESLQGETHKFSIEGVDFSFSADTSLSTIINEINASDAGVKISYLEAEDRFVMERTATGLSTDRFEMHNTEGNFLTALFGVKGTGNVSGAAISKDLVSKTLTEDELTQIANDYKRGGKFTLNINGSDQTFTLKQKDHEDTTDYTIDDLVSLVNTSLGKTYGKDTEGKQYVSFELKDNQFVISSTNKNVVIKAVDKGDNNKNTLGFTVGDSNRITDGSGTLKQAGINFDGGAGTSFNYTVNGVEYTNNVSFTWDENSTVDSVASDLQNAIRDSILLKDADYNVSNINVVYDTNSSSFKITGVKEQMDISIKGGTGASGTEKLFGSDEIKLNTASTEASNVFTEGQNAILKVDGSEIQRSSNTFTLNGLSFTLNSTTIAGYHPETSEPIYEKATQINTVRDTDKIYDGLKEFIKQYNEMVEYVNGLYKAEAKYKDYPPLTDAQKNSMSDKEVEKWEEKSKEGLLRGDQTLGSILQNLRSIIYQRPEGSNIALYDLGITTGYFQGDGTLNVDSDEKLKAAIESDPDAIKKLFSSNDGLIKNMDKAITEATKISYGSPGSLVRLAGAASGDYDSTISKQMKDLDKQMVSLESRYWKEYDRYWRQFNKMETLIQQMNSQSSWLSSQLG